MHAQTNIRLDLADGSLEQPERQDDGAVIYTGRVARTGAHQYPWGMERRDAEELQGIVRQLPGILVTAMHPPKLLAHGGKARLIGTILSARYDRASRHTDVDHAVARMHVKPEGVALIQAGIRELSLGYETKAIQGRHTNTRIDHLALVMLSRCGDSCAVRSDCAGDTCQCGQGFSPEVRIINQLIAMRGK